MRASFEFKLTATSVKQQQARYRTYCYRLYIERTGAICVECMACYWTLLIQIEQLWRRHFLCVELDVNQKCGFAQRTLDSQLCCKVATKRMGCRVGYVPEYHRRIAVLPYRRLRAKPHWFGSRKLDVMLLTPHTSC